MDDLISRQDAVSLPVMPKRYRHYMSLNLDDVYEQGWEDLQMCIEHMPSAQPRMTCDGCKYANHPTGWSDVCILCIRNFRNFTDRYER